MLKLLKPLSPPKRILPWLNSQAGCWLPKSSPLKMPVSKFLIEGKAQESVTLPATALRLLVDILVQSDA